MKALIDLGQWRDLIQPRFYWLTLPLYGEGGEGTRRRREVRGCLPIPGDRQRRLGPGGSSWDMGSGQLLDIHFKVKSKLTRFAKDHLWEYEKGSQRWL